MSCLPDYRKAEIRAAIAKKKTQLAKAEASYEKALSEDIISYKFDSGEGSQNVNTRKLKAWSDEIDRLESQINALQRKLYGAGLVNIVPMR